MSDNTGKPYAEGHAIYTGEGAEKTMLAKGITFVDGKNRADAGQDGSFEHPYSTIRQALAKAGENAVVFVADGEYNEEVELRPGQTLTSEIAGFATREPPRIRPDEKTYRYAGASGASAEGSWDTMFAVVVTLRENTTLRRMELVIDGPVKPDEQLSEYLSCQKRHYGLTAIWVEAAEGAEDFDINVEGNTLRVKRNGACWYHNDTALWVRLKNGVTRGRVRIARNRCHAVYGMRIELLQNYFHPASALHRIGLRENVIETVTSGIRFTIEGRGAGDEIDCIDNVISSDEGVAIDEFASGNTMRLHNNWIRSISGKAMRVGVYVDGRGWPDKASSATMGLRGNTIRATRRGIGILSDKNPPIFDRNQLVADNDIQVSDENGVAVG